MTLNELQRMANRGIQPWARRNGIGLIAGAMLLSPISGVWTLGAWAQAPSYQSPVNAPTPQYKLPVPAAITPNGQVVEDVIVRINDQIINRSDLERAEQQLQQEAQQSGANPQETAEHQRDLLRDLIDKQLLLSRGKDLGINADAEVIRQLDDIRKQNHMDTMEDLEKAAQQQGVSFEDFKANIRNTIISQEVVRDEVGRHLQMTSAQEQAFYDEHKNEFARPEQIRLSEILVPTPADASEAVVAQAQDKANGIEKQLKAGDKFEDLAKLVSGGPTAAQGGDLGEFKRGGLAKVLEDQTFDLPAGQFTAPIRTRQGFVILKVTEHQAAGVPPLKDIEPQIQEAMYTQQMQPALRTYLTKLREEAYIDIKPGFVDSGASPKQTKPVFTAYSAPISKKEKKAEKKKARFDRGGAFSTASAVGHGPTPKPTVIKLDKNGKPKKVRREKIRFGQAPEQSLPPGPVQTASGVDAGAGSAQAAGAGATLAPGTLTAPGQAIAPLDQENTPDANPLAPKTGPKVKSRYSDRAPTIKASKAKAKTAKAQDKAIATATPMTAEEKAASQTQAAPLGLNGDTAKKKKKKRKKGEAKERLQPKAKDPNAAPVRNPDGSYPTPYHAPPTTPAVNGNSGGANNTTLPPVTTPAPGAQPAGGTPPATPGIPDPTVPPANPPATTTTPQN
jgi:peptidyl-prolyl cis-trans isomerase SurA